jgi:hypothetical protein
VPLSDGEQIGAIGAGAALVVVIAGAVVRAAAMRGETHNKWQRRVLLADTALEDKEIDELKDLQGALEKVLPPGTDAPALSTFDPSPLAKRTSEIAKLHTSRERMRRAFKWLRRLGDIFTALLSLLVLAIVLLTLHYADLWNVAFSEAAGLIAGGVAVAGLVFGGLAYIVLQHVLATAQIMSGWADPPTAEE